jgi:hypothetical protein
MNIVKFKDIYLETNKFSTPEQEKYNTIYNEQLKNKYWGVINWKWLAPLDMYFDKYIYLSLNPNEVPDDFILLDDYKEYIDLDETERSNSANVYIEKNKFVADEDITIDELKLFRKWLAELIYNIYEMEDDEKVMLNYYANNMYDDTIKNLTLVSKNNTILNTVTSSCGCCNNSYSVIYDQSLQTCQPIMVYIKDIYNIMVKYFSELSYWVDKKDICLEIKKYIDNIVKLNFPLSITDFSNVYTDCTCAVNNNLQETYKRVLIRLSQVMEWIANDDISGHRNEINDVLTIWAKELYQNMQW